MHRCLDTGDDPDWPSRGHAAVASEPASTGRRSIFVARAAALPWLCWLAVTVLLLMQWIHRYSFIITIYNNTIVATLINSLVSYLLENSKAEFDETFGVDHGDFDPDTFVIFILGGGTILLRWVSVFTSWFLIPEPYTFLVENKSDIEVLAIGIGHDVSRYYDKAIKITDVNELGDVMISELSSLFDTKKKYH